MFEKDIIPLRRIKLVVFYHEDEVTDYAPSYAYVEENKLSWVSFIVIKGEVNTGDLLKKNQWTEQFKAIFDKTDGIIFTGGMDIPPAIYGEKQLLLTKATTPVRNYYELSFLFHLLGGSQDPEFVPFLESHKDYVVLGICLGCQTMNVACGGTLYQDIPSQVYGFTTVEQVLNAGQENIHSSRYLKDFYPLEEDLAPVFHRIKLKKNSIFVKQMKMKEKDTPFILTSHHQALQKLGKNLLVAATSMDGKIIEAIEHQKYKNVLGIQFHPEPYSLYQKGRYFKKVPGQPLDFNLRYFLEDNPPSMSFHKKIWLWFSQSLKD
jgi:putative glutamine amidotransferase